VTRQFGRARVTFDGMVSAEPWTLRRLGSAQVLQVGETLDGGALRDYQHPHDLLMAVNGRIDWTASSTTTVFVSGGPVASPSLGPTTFMHRPSSGPNPTTPLAHHNLDSTHITHGVITAGVQRGVWTFESSVFHGREPDEDRVGLDMGALDSMAARLSWRRGPWRAQVSAGRLNEPERAERGDLVRSTASVEFDRVQTDGRRTAWMAAWGLNDKPNHLEAGWLFEGRRDITVRDTVYSRAELVDRFILVDFDFAARTGLERHLRSWVAALTIGYERTVMRRSHVAVGLGTDVTVHQVSANLRDSYGRPMSFHVYARVSAH
jgi:hypothetical protein